MSTLTPIYAFVSYPEASLTESLIKSALGKLSSKFTIHNSLPSSNTSDGILQPLLQWSTYDLISHELTMSEPTTVLSSSYVIRKALIRKHYLHRSLQTYFAKNPDTVLKDMVPPTWYIDISHGDELDEMWADELYDLGQVLPETAEDAERGGGKWYILKPGMSDRGMGIRLFFSKAGLQQIFESFEPESDEEEEENATNVATSQLRHFVIQEYLPNPLLLDPRETLSTKPALSDLQGRKFHLRAYAFAQGAIKVHLFTRILALFSSTAYVPPTAEEEGSASLSAHLTNTSLQESHGEENVRLLEELVGCCRILSPSEADKDRRLTKADVDRIVDEVAICLGETFRAGLTSPVHFQTLPNAFELFGVDLLVTFDAQTDPSFHVSVLELNAEPAIHLTGSRLGWILEELFDEMATTCVAPFFSPLKQDDNHAQAQSLTNDRSSTHAVDVRSQKRGHLRIVLDIQVRGANGW